MGMGESACQTSSSPRVRNSIGSGPQSDYRLMTAGWTVRPMIQVWLTQDVSLAPTIAPHSLGVVVVASWGPAGTARAAIPGWNPSTSGTGPGRAAVARQGVSPTTTVHAGLTAIGRAGRLVD